MCFIDTDAVDEVQRPGVVASPIGPQPDVTGPDIADVVDVVDQIIAVDLG